MLLSFILLVRNGISHQVVPDKEAIKLRRVKGMVPGNQVHSSTAPCQTPHLVVLQPTVDGADTRCSCCVECYGCLRGIVRINSSPDEYILYSLQLQLTFCKINDGSFSKNTLVTNPNATNIATLSNWQLGIRLKTWPW